MVLRDWQTTNGAGGRGYNIGSVLVDPEGNPVCWARNAVNALDDGTRHGEVRLITNYLHNKPDLKKLKKYTVYTTLEPCAMCAGMMTLTEVERTVYGQTDPDYGGVFERLQANQKGCGGPCPYPRGVIAAAAETPVRSAIDAAFHASGKDDITAWLASDEARALFARAADELAAGTARFPENESVLEKARRYLARVPATTPADPYTDACE